VRRQSVGVISTFETWRARVILRRVIARLKKSVLAEAFDGWAAARQRADALRRCARVAARRWAGLGVAIILHSWAELVRARVRRAVCSPSPRRWPRTPNPEGSEADPLLFAFCAFRMIHVRCRQLSLNIALLLSTGAELIPRAGR
jgi:hypothetical protein